MRPPRSSSCSKCSSASSSSYSLAATSLKSRLLTIFKKAQELTTLCDIEACVIHYGPDGEMRTWPENRDIVRSLALRYIQLDQAKRRKKSVNLYEFLNKNKDKKTMLNKFKKRNVEELKYPISDHYSPDQINQLIHSLELSYSTLQERRRFLAAKANLEDRQHSMNPSQFTPLPQELYVNDKNNTFQHLCVSDYSEVQESALRYQLMPYGGYDQNMCMGNINNVQHPWVSNAQPPELQEPNQLMQHEPYGFDQNMCMGDTTNSCNVVDPCLPNMLPDDFCFDFQDPYGGNMVGNPSFSQDFFPDMTSSYVYEADYFRNLLYHLSSSNIPNDNSEISSNLPDDHRE
ncbi:PREDICTED: agamous-like MADS-box protein AGL93 [Brassica oleracea var. oleracea]|uniref:MADS-box domain-containing protein n=1 Tax=Brassica oleracea var. oleracea TaxID=109376 RepID=A0A0D3C017_BRAOL|nr:PREDICTED: agamous-like MADS-box protein AGL93 [Brassica oleracea var. oleracea]